MFKKFLFIFTVLSFFLFYNNSVCAEENQNKWWSFEKWVVDININKDSTFIVRETQTFNFHGNFHWAKRDIAKKKLRAITDVKVFDESGRELTYPEVEITEDATQVSIKLNFDLTDTQKTWTFEYKVIGGLGYFEATDKYPAHTELYWNAISYERDVPIKEVEVFVHLPEAVEKEKMMQTLYKGPAGNTIPSNTYQIIDEKTFKFWGSNIGPYKNFTIVAGWPRGIISEPGILKINSEPSAKVVIDGKATGFSTPAVLEENYEISSGEHKVSVKKFGWQVEDEAVKTVNISQGKIVTLDFKLKKTLWLLIIDKMSYLIPILLGIFLFKKYKAVPKLKKTIIAQYEPPSRSEISPGRQTDKLSPAEVGGLVYGAVRPKDFTATLIDLAYRGYLKIVEKEKKILWKSIKEYSLIERKSFIGDATLRDHEVKFLEAIFGFSNDTVEISALGKKPAFQSAMMKLPKEILKKMVGEEGYFSQTPMPRMAGCIFAIILASFSSALIPTVLILFSGFAIGKAIAISIFLLIIYLAVKPPPYTEKGIEAKWHALGFKEYLQVAERFRLGACTPETFEQYLSYAIVFGVEKQWAARFVDIYKTQPDWYESARPITGFNSVIFANTISSMASSVSAVVSYSSPSGSSGFGGGGGGAGGGGGGGGSSAG